MLKQKGHSPKAAVSSLHRKRINWFIVMFSGLVAIQLAYNFRLNQPKLFSYATDIDTKSLLEQTNQVRQNNGQALFASSELLTKAAQSKAQEMIAKNYWKESNSTSAANFLKNYNYKFSSVAENLAYGFTTTDEIVSGWLSKDVQKSNIYGDFKEVGFGVASSSNYQGGDNTVVVALYANPGQSGSPLAQPATVNNSFAQVGGLTTVTSGSATWATYASLGLIGAATIGFFVTHLELLRLGWYKGRHFMLIHPLFDIAVIVSLALILIYAVQGFIG